MTSPTGNTSSQAGTLCMVTHSPSRLCGPHRPPLEWQLDRGVNQSQAGIRLELVRQVRDLIAAGEYDTPERFELALERLLDRLGLE